MKSSWERQLEMGTLLSSAINILYEVKTNPHLAAERKLDLIHNLQEHILPVVNRHLMYMINSLPPTTPPSLPPHKEGA